MRRCHSGTVIGVKKLEGPSSIFSNLHSGRDYLKNLMSMHRIKQGDIKIQDRILLIQGRKIKHFRVCHFGMFLKRQPNKFWAAFPEARPNISIEYLRGKTRFFMFVGFFLNLTRSSLTNFPFSILLSILKKKK